MQDVLTQESLSTAEYKDIVFITVATSLYQIVMIMCDVTKEPTIRMCGIGLLSNTHKYVSPHVCTCSRQPTTPCCITMATERGFSGSCLASVWMNNKTTALLNFSLSVLMHLLPFQQQFVPICLLPFVCV